MGFPGTAEHAIMGGMKTKPLLFGVIAGCALAACGAEWTWLEREALPVEGKGFADTETYFCRLPVRAKGVVRDPLWHMGRQATGIYVRFRTDAERLAFRWKVDVEHPTDPLIPEAGLSGIDIYRLEPGKGWRFAGNKRYWQRVGGTNVAGQAEIAWKPGQAGIVYLPTRSWVRDFKIGVPEGRKLEAFPHAAGHEKPIVHYGTSIVHGGCASRPGLTFTAIAGRSLDRNYINLGFSGNGRMEKEMAPFMAEIDAALYVVDCAWNMSPALVEENGAEFLRALSARRPGTPILLCEGCTQEASPPARNVAMRKVYESLKAEDPARWANLYYFSASEMFPADDAELTHDFCHPNDYGSMFMGPAYAKRIREVLEADAAAKGGFAFPNVDFASAAGPVKPVNGVGQPPLLGYNNTRLFRYLKDAGIPYSRLHDTGGAYGKNIFVDIPNLFRDFDADENDPASYDFAFTDLLLKALVENGVEPYFRLGVTIENAQRVKAYRIFPPKDYAKWARICEHVIRHYTEGWANGFRFNISHWEIWNEPDGAPTIERQTMWKAPFSEYIRLYGVASKHLKAKFPHLKIGGYASCGFYDVASSRGKTDDVRMKHLMSCFTNFLDHARAERMPLDFFSFHCYDTPEFAGRQIEYCRRTLDAYGFKDTEMSLNEWLTRGGLRALGSPRQAAEIAAMLAIMQNGPVDDAEIYDARCGVGDYSPLFNCLTYKPHKAYHVYLAFNELRKLGTAVKVEGGSDGLWACAAKGADGKSGAVFAANTTASAMPLPKVLGAAKAVRSRAIDADHDFADVELSDTIGPKTALLIEYELSDDGKARAAR